MSQRNSDLPILGKKEDARIDAECVYVCLNKSRRDDKFVFVGDCRGCAERLED